MELRVQEGDHWDFTLYQAGEVVCDFSTHVGYFDADPSKPRPWKQGDSESFARVWKVSNDVIKPYLIDWGALSGPRFVARGDKYQAGDWRQIYDFMKAIGVQPPEENPGKFSFRVPLWTDAYKPQWWWWRIIRNVSVRIKGTYPDVPPLTAEQRALWEQRRASVRIVKMDLDNGINDEAPANSD